MSAWTYILYSANLDRYYVGATSMTVNERLRRHLATHRHFTSKAKDWEILWTQRFDTKAEAIAREREIKKWKSRLRIETLIRNHPRRNSSV